MRVRDFFKVAGGDVEVLAKRTGRSPSTIRQWRRQGRIPESAKELAAGVVRRSQGATAAAETRRRNTRSVKRTISGFFRLAGGDVEVLAERIGRTPRTIERYKREGVPKSVIPLLAAVVNKTKASRKGAKRRAKRDEAGWPKELRQATPNAETLTAKTSSGAIKVPTKTEVRTAKRDLTRTLETPAIELAKLARYAGHPVTKVREQDDPDRPGRKIVLGVDRHGRRMIAAFLVNPKNGRVTAVWRHFPQGSSVPEPGDPFDDGVSESIDEAALSMRWEVVHSWEGEAA